MRRRFRRIQSQIAPALQRQHSATLRALQVSLLDEIRFDDVFQNIALVRERGRERFDTGRAARTIHRKIIQITPVHCVETVWVDAETAQRRIGRVLVDIAVAVDQRKVAHPS